MPKIAGAIETQGGRASGALGVVPSLNLAPLSDVLGAEITDVDLSKPQPEAMVQAIREAFLKHRLLVFRDQSLQPADIQRFAELFGEIEGNIVKKADGSIFEAVHTISNLDADGKPSTNPLLKADYGWHSDKSYLPTPSLMTMLYGVEIPPAGGDTQFANMTMAYEALPEATKREIADLQVVHSFAYMLEGIGNPSIVAEGRQLPPPVVHPMVQTHPETGEKSLFIGMYSSDVVGLPREEGRKLIAELLAHATQERFLFTQRWRQNDFVIWDNRCLLHRAVANYNMSEYRRMLQRCVVRGSIPH